MPPRKILVTGAAGFIGFHLAQALLARGEHVVGLDNLNDYYSVPLKRARLALLTEQANFEFVQIDCADRQAMDQLFAKERFARVAHLAAQAGVRYSLTNPHAYIDSNLVGFINILEGCRHHGVEHLLYASSSSVYGSNKLQPFSVHHSVDHPVSLYAATKKANELMAHTYSHLYDLPTTGLRFFTVYGPWGRPDMALYIFTKAISEGRPIDVYNHGQMRRDFTYIDDIVEAMVRLVDTVPTPDATFDPLNPDPGTSNCRYRVYNIGNHQPEELGRFIELIELALGRPATKNLLPMQAGDVMETYADTRSLEAAIGFKPSTNLATGIARFVQWYQEYHSIGGH
ncbi:MAG: NAD-dependent epimerase [Pirellulaceae bacterium]|nr:NAD-dependent epimerase [Pirellulaceae bacterium]